MIARLPPPDGVGAIEGAHKMSNDLRAVAARLSVMAMLAVPASAFAQTPAKPLAESLVGHWRLVSVDIGGAHPLGASPQGSMFLDAAGNYSVIVIGEGAAKGIAYFGAYKVDAAAGSLTMHIEAGSRPDAAGRDETRLVKLDGDELILENSTPRHAPSAIKLIWKRAD